jgi:predicted CoA-substrate-specific enzyme activase
MKYYLGLDIGSVSINTVVMDENRRILEDRYDYCRGRPFALLVEILRAVAGTHGEENLCRIGITGTGGPLAASLIGGHYVNEIVAQSCAVSRLYGEVRTVIEMGGEDSKLIFMERCGDRSELVDFAMNSICAAGTGSFLDQQAKRIGVSIENEFGQLALESSDPPRIAGRCSVFAKSDMIHLQQIATPLCDIVAGLCFAVARNFKSHLARGKDLLRPVIFQGGVAANAGMVRAFREVFDLPDGEPVVPEHHASMGAIGSLFHLLDYPPKEEHLFRGFAALERHVSSNDDDCETLSPLFTAVSVPDGLQARVVQAEECCGVTDVYLGLDVGSLSTNVVLIDDENRVIARRYLPTAGKPLEAIRRGMEEINAEAGDRVRVRAVGTTGSGRYLTGDFVGADTIQNEITSQATAAIAIDPSVDTVFEIGGQDSKFISIDHGVIVDFEMNKVCAAGTGSFLEEQAEKLGVDIIDEFGKVAIEAQKPVKLGDRCTVFMESDLNAHQQKGARKENLVAGLSYSIVYNYLQKVVGTRRVADRIFFQGGVAHNRSVVAAFEKVTGKPIVVPPHHDVTGAIGAAMLARDAVGSGPTRFKGFSIGRKKYTVDKFTCKSCPNRCEIRRVRIEGESRPLFYGGRCERYEMEDRKKRGKDIENLFEVREKLLFGNSFPDNRHIDNRSIENQSSIYNWPDNRHNDNRAIDNQSSIYKWPDNRHSIGSLIGDQTANNRSIENQSIIDSSIEDRTIYSLPADSRQTIGIPRGLMVFYQQFPFWRLFFETLGFRVILSSPSSHSLVTKSLELIAAETCFPVEVMHGHVFELLRMGVDHVWLPSVVNSKAEKENPTVYYNCPWVQTVPYMVRALLRRTEDEKKLMTPALHFRYSGAVLNRELASYMGARFGFAPSAVRDAVREADRAQCDFERRVREAGREAMERLDGKREAIVVIGRPYNTNDPQLNLNLIHKLMNLEVLPVPMDFLPLEKENIYGGYRMMYWPNGRRILEAARIVANDCRLNAVYLGNFRCGPDSFLSHFVREEMKGKPYLQLEVDEHSADAGMITRCEAFLDSLRKRSLQGLGRKGTAALQQQGADSDSRRAVSAPQLMRHAPLKERTLYVPYMSDHAYVLAAGSRSCGVHAEVLPPQDETDLDLGRRYTSSRECFPMICTTGSFLKKAFEKGFDPAHSSFFMPDHNGPCRFGQYNRLQRTIFDRLGFGEVELISPGNDNAYADLSGGRVVKFWVPVWKGTVGIDMLRKLLQKKRPYERVKGESNRLYVRYRDELIKDAELGGKNIEDVLTDAAEAFSSIETTGCRRKPIISVTGEIFMRDNPFCSGHVIEKLELLGAETMIAPVREWIHYSTYRYFRDSVWKRDLKGIVSSKLFEFFQHLLERGVLKSVAGSVELFLDIPIREVLKLCSPYVDKSYDGEPAIIMGSSAGQVPAGISGIANILPFTCMPGTLITAISQSFRSDYDNIPWVNIVYDGQQDTGMDTRLEAFMYQTKEYANRRKPTRLAAGGKAGTG